MKRHLLLVCFFMLSWNALASTPQEVWKQLEQHLFTQDQLLKFVQLRSCASAGLTECAKPLSAQEMTSFKQLIRQVDSERVALFEQALPSFDVLQGHPAELKLAPQFSAKLKLRWFEQYWQIGYSPLDEKARQFMQQARVFAAAHVMMYDQFFRLADALNDTPRLRQVMEEDLPNEGKMLSRLYATAIDEKRWQSTSASVLMLAEEAKLRGPQELSTEELLFAHYLQEAFTAERMRQKDESYRLHEILVMQRQLGSGRLTDRLQRLIGKLSQVFGNAAGQVQTRDGKLKHLASDATVMQGLQARLKPLDIMFEKTPMRLTDRFIPGFYGHVAIWLGPVSDWGHYTVEVNGSPLPLLAHPTVLARLPEINANKGVLEALRLPGVTLNTLAHFMDIDDWLVVRQEFLDEAVKGRMILKALEQYGKPYDFNFDVETEREIVCSELAYVVYDQESWPTDHTMGRYTISPDQVAIKVLDGRFTPVLMYHDGKKVEGDMTEELRSLLAEGIAILFN